MFKDLPKKISRLIQSTIDISIDPRNQRGYQAITTKSIHYKSNLARDLLMEIVMLIDPACNLAIFLSNLTDCRILMNSPTDVSVKFFEKSFVTTEFCELVTTADWLHNVKTMLVCGGSAV